MIKPSENKACLALRLTGGGEFCKDFHRRFQMVDSQLTQPLECCYDRFQHALCNKASASVQAQLAAELDKHGVHAFVNMLQPSSLWLHESLQLKTMLRTAVTAALNFTDLRDVLWEHRDTHVVTATSELIVRIVCR